jgi:hypothetical protein
MCRKVLLVFTISLILLLILTSVSFAVPKQGKWKATGKGKWEDGKTSEISFAFYFTSGNPQKTICTVCITRVDVEICFTGASMTITNPIIRISNFIPGVNSVVSGEFNSDTTASGTWEVKDVSIVQLGIKSLDVKGTWTAQYTDAIAVSPGCNLATSWGKVKKAE